MVTAPLHNGFGIRMLTPTLCEKCRYPGQVYRANFDGNLAYTCLRCHQSWTRPWSEEFKIVNHEENDGKFLGIFYGPWGADEQKIVSSFFRSRIYQTRTQQEWSFFKGRAVYTAWRTGGGAVVSGRSAAEIIQKVASKCGPTTPRR